VDLGHAAAKSTLGAFLVSGNARAGVAKDAARGFELARQAFAQGIKAALYTVADCYLAGEGVEKDAAHAVSLLRQAVMQGGAKSAKAMVSLAMCYDLGEGVEADTVQAALWCQRAVTGGAPGAIDMLSVTLQCEFCGATPAHLLCGRCRKVRYCGAVCQRAHWTRTGESDPHKGRCRRAADSGASTSAGA
jgi:hypothetical protein